MTVHPVLTSPPAPAPGTAPPRRIAVLATLGDSTAVGLGDPLPDRGWRGFGILLRDAVGAAVLVNPARTGATVASVRAEQLASAVAAAPDVAVVFAGMNDTLRAHFDRAELAADLGAIVRGLGAVGAHVVLVRHHDHSRVFVLPAPLRRALQGRIAALNDVVDEILVAATRAGVHASVLDLAALPGTYDRSMWSVDRLHPSERGHRLLAAAIGELLATAGFAVPVPVGLGCSGGRCVSDLERAVWLVAKGVPWAVRRGRDLGPVVLRALLDGAAVRPAPARSRGTAR